MLWLEVCFDSLNYSFCTKVRKEVNTENERIKRKYHLHQFPLALEPVVVAPVAVDMVPFVEAHSAVVDLGRVASLELHALTDSVDPVDSIDSWPVDGDTLGSHTVDLAHTVARIVDSIEGEKDGLVEPFLFCTLELTKIIFLRNGFHIFFKIGFLSKIC